MNMYDVIICVGWREMQIVKKTVQYVRMNLRPDIIYLIMSSYYFHCFSADFLKKYNVRLLDEDCIIDGVTYKDFNFQIKQKNTGWYFQQFLKYGFAMTPYCKNSYLVWDADTIPLRKIDFMRNDKFLFTPKKEYHKPYFDTIYTLFGYKKNNNFSYIAEHMIMYTPAVKSLINMIISNIKGNSSWVYKIMDVIPLNEAHGFSEFETYGLYIENNFPNLYEPQYLTCWRSAGMIFGRYITKREAENLSFDLDLISLESVKGKFFFRSLYMGLWEFYMKFRRYLYMRSNHLEKKSFFSYLSSSFSKRKVLGQD